MVLESKHSTPSALQKSCQNTKYVAMETESLSNMKIMSKKYVAMETEGLSNKKIGTQR